MMWISAAPKLCEKLFQEMSKLSDEEFKELLEAQLVEYLNDATSLEKEPKPPHKHRR
jgi:hypothetical protein